MARFFKRWLAPLVVLVAIGGATLLLRPHRAVSWFAKRFPDVLFCVGVYLYRLHAGDYVETKRMAVVQ